MITAGRKLAILRKKAGLSLQEIADLLGIPKSTYNSREIEGKTETMLPEWVREIAPILASRGVSEVDIWKDLTGFVPSHLVNPAPEEPLQFAMRIAALTASAMGVDEAERKTRAVRAVFKDATGNDLG